MTTPSAIARFPPEAFSAAVACTGEQFAALLRSLPGEARSYRWFCADVRTNGRSPFPASSAPTDVGDTTTLETLARSVDQFDSGVFLAVPSSVTSPMFRDNPVTDDEPGADLGSAVLEVRAFDWSYLELAGVDAALVHDVARKFGRSAQAPGGTAGE